MYIVSVANHHNTEIKSRAANTINEARVILLDAFLEALKARDTILGEDGFPEPPKAGENHIAFEELDERNYVDMCPECSDQEFWHSGRCGHCGFTF